jgi:hypothetical protein
MIIQPSLNTILKINGHIREKRRPWSPFTKEMESK